METLETSETLFIVIRPNQSFAYYLRRFEVSLGPAAQLHGEHFPQHGLFQLCWKSIQAVLCPSSSLFAPHQNDNLRCVSMFSLMRQVFQWTESSSEDVWGVCSTVSVYPWASSSPSSSDAWNVVLDSSSEIKVLHHFGSWFIIFWLIDSTANKRVNTDKEEVKKEDAIT